MTRQKAKEMTMDRSRREFFRRSGSAMLGASLLGSLEHVAFADSEQTFDNPTLICIYLRGGADSLNAVVPYGDPTYYQIRPTIGIPAEDDGEDKGVIRLNKMFGLNPAFASLHPLFEKGLVAPIINVGSPHPTRSHFDAQDFMEYAAPGVRTVTEGWLNRFLQLTSKGTADSELRALAMQSLLPRMVRGEYPVLAVPTVNPDEALDAFSQLYESCNEDVAMQRATMRSEKDQQPMGDQDAAKSEAENRFNIIASGHNTVRLLRRLRSILGQQGAASVGYPTSRLGQQLGGLAKVIKARVGLEIAALDVRGWDHHARQGSTDGVYHRMLTDVSDSLTAFANDLGPALGKTLVLVMSEFGRTARENGNNGSDHGHGGFMLALGGMVRGNKIYGEWKGLDASNLYEGRDMPVNTDFRLIFAEVLQRVFKFNPFSTKHGFFPEYKPTAKPLDFLTQL
jgi:uncharacterized protein (DUF1501 family)